MTSKTTQASSPALSIVPDTDITAPVRLDSHSPLYLQITDILRARILDGSYQPNHQMMSESEMMATFGVSRITVRQALNNLQSEGLIFRIPGKGSFVSRPRAFQNLGSLQGFGTAMREMGYETHSQVLSARAMKPPQQVLERLQLAKGDKVMELRRLRFLNREPISVDVSYLPQAIGARVAKADLANRDIFAILENDLQIALGHADLQINSTLADDALAAQLRVTEGSPVLFIERVIHTPDGSPLEYEELYYRGDAFRFKVRVDRVATQSLA
jgi:GntR family transcriptional regulator